MAQLVPGPGQVDANLERLVALLDEHPDVDLAAFPELFLGGYDLATVAELAVPVEDPVVLRIREAAARRSTAVVAGFAERTADGRIANAAMVIDADGRLAAVHRKTHLFGAEEGAFTRGETLHVVDLAGVRVAPLICFEMEFPEPARAAARAGAEVLVTIAANMAPYGADHELASRARALDNRLPHVYVNRAGDEAGLEFEGGSQAIACDGTVLAGADAGVGRGETIVVAEVVVGAPVADGAVDYLRHGRAELPVALVAGA